MQDPREVTRAEAAPGITHRAGVPEALGGAAEEGVYVLGHGEVGEGRCASDEQRANQPGVGAQISTAWSE
ncbi:MAG: hypothetical protein IPK80_03905 [Nannocystis sp.]|nr:hypothetical protein [Nannocystis sp.]